MYSLPVPLSMWPGRRKCTTSRSAVRLYIRVSNPHIGPCVARSALTLVSPSLAHFCRRVFPLENRAGFRGRGLDHAGFRKSWRSLLTALVITKAGQQNGYE